MSFLHIRVVCHCFWRNFPIFPLFGLYTSSYVWQSTLGCRNVITRTKSGCGKVVLSSFSLCTASCHTGYDRGALVYATSSRGDWFGVTGEADSTTVRLLLVPSMMGSIKAYVDIFETHVVFTMPSFTSWDSVRMLCGFHYLRPFWDTFPSGISGLGKGSVYVEGACFINPFWKNWRIEGIYIRF